MVSRAVFIIVVISTLLKGSTSQTCPKEVVNITALLQPDKEYEIHSPGFPNDYPANASCTWHVTLSDSLPRRMYGIGLMVDTWEIETCSNCGCDYLTYGDKWSIESTFPRRCNIHSENYLSLVKAIGSPFYIVRRDTELWLKFHSDSSSQFKGFKGHVRAYNRMDSCDNYINATTGSIASPKYPSLYPKGQEITWCLAVPQGFRVKLKFSAFELEDTKNKDNECINDFVEVRDGGTLLAGRTGGYGKLLGRFCGSTIPTEEIYSLSNQMWVLFVSDSNATTVYKGFKADFVNSGNVMASSLVVWLLATVMRLLL